VQLLQVALEGKFFFYPGFEVPIILQICPPVAVSGTLLGLNLGDNLRPPGRIALVLTPLLQQVGEHLLLFGMGLQVVGAGAGLGLGVVLLQQGQQALSGSGSPTCASTQWPF
jgi:hypothetical protein